MGAQNRNTESASENIPASHGATYLIVIQVVSRALTFISNQFLLRHLSPPILGLATQLELYSISTLYFSRESFRIALQQHSVSAEPKDVGRSKGHRPDVSRHLASNASRQTQAAVNASYFTILIGFPLAYILAQAYQHVRLADGNETQYFKESLAIVGASTAIELGSEPCFAAMQQSMLFRRRAAIEMASAFVKSISSCAVVMWMSNRSIAPSVLPFAVGQLGYAITLFCGYLVSAYQLGNTVGFSLVPRALYERGNGSSTAFSRMMPLPLLSRSANVYLQCVAKHFLTQGDSMILAAFASLEEQGQYALASNYGGLVARMIFQPIEESSRNALGKLLAPSKERTSTPQQIAAAKSYIYDILHAYSVISILIFAIGPTVVPILLRFVVGSRWASAEMHEVLSAYCYYVPFLAFNGVTEAFVSSVANNSEIRQQTAWMGVFSAVFAAAVYILLGLCGLGAVGLVWANIMNMALRIIWCYWFMTQYFNHHHSPLRIAQTLPSFGTSIAGAVGYASMVGIQPSTVSDLHDIAKVCGIAAVFGVSVLYLERNFIIQKIADYR